MVFAEGTLTFKEFAVKEPLPLSTIQEAVLEIVQFTPKYRKKPSSGA